MIDATQLARVQWYREVGRRAARDEFGDTVAVFCHPGAQEIAERLGLDYERELEAIDKWDFEPGAAGREYRVGMSLEWLRRSRTVEGVCRHLLDLHALVGGDETFPAILETIAAGERP